MKRISIIVLTCLVLFGCGKTPEEALQGSGSANNGGNNPPVNQPVIGTDSTGTIQLLEFLPIENFRTLGDVNFSVKTKVTNASNANSNVAISFDANTSTGNTVYTNTINLAVGAGQTVTTITSFGQPLTAAQYDSISTWNVTSIAKTP